MSSYNDKIVLGWCEWIDLPELQVPSLRAKVDTGAKTSSLHAEQCVEFEREDEWFVRFVVCTRHGTYSCESRVVERRSVRSSTGHEEHRPVISTLCNIHGTKWEIELTLTDRTPMKFPMLLGRQALDGQFVVDPQQKYLHGKPRRKHRN